MRIGIVCPYDAEAPGGVQQLCAELATHLAGSGDDVVLVTAGVSGPHRAGKTTVETIAVGPTIRVKANASVAPITLSPGSWSKTREVLRHVDVVHVHEPLVPLVAWAGLAMANPTVATFHADAPGWVSSLYRLIPGRRPLGRRTILTAVSGVAASAIPSRWGSPRIIPNAIDAAAYRSNAEKMPNQVAFLGRDEPRKGLDHLLAAWPSIHSKNSDSELVVMGAQRHRSLPGVTFVGTVDDETKREYLASSSIFVAPNTGGESFGIVVVEAMAAGCAVVASDIPAFRSVIGDSGRLVPPRDPDAIAAAVNLLLDDTAEMSSLGLTASKASERYDWSRVLGDYQNAYEDAAAM